MPRNRLLVYGDVEMDILLKSTPLSPDAHDAMVEGIAFSAGGSAANCAAIAGSLGQSVSYLGSVGDDVWSNLLIRDLKKNKVNTRYVKKSAGNSGTCVAIVSADGDRRFYSYRGMNEIDPPDVPPDEDWKKFRCLHLSGYSFQEPNSRRLAAQLLKKAKEHNLMVSLDPSYLFARDLEGASAELLKEVDFFFPNKDEAALISHKNDPLAAAHVLHGMGVRVVIVTLDKDGCLILADGVEAFIRLDPPGRVIDTTGAGDAFCGGFLTAVLGGMTLEEAGKLGSASAAHIVTQMGAHEHPPRMLDILEIMRLNHENEIVNLITEKIN